MTDTCPTCGVPQSPVDFIAIYGGHEALVKEREELEKKLRAAVGLLMDGPCCDWSEADILEEIEERVKQ